MAAESKLEAARRTGSLTNVIGALRDEARTELTNAGTPVREQKDIVDGSIALATHLAGQGTKGSERRQVMSGVQPGTTVTAQGATKTQLSRREKLERVKTWASALTEEQRTAYMISDKYGALSENAQDVIAEAFSDIEDRAYEDSIGIANVDFDAPSPDVDSIIGDEDDGEAEADDLGDSDFEAMFEQAAWEAEQTS